MVKKKILIIDDEVSITKLLKFALEKTGLYEVLCENQGSQAVASIQKSRPDLILLDLNLPDVPGGEIAAAIQKDASMSRLPVVFLTGSVTGDEVDAGLTIGGYPALAKPIDMDKLLSCLQNCLGG